MASKQQDNVAEDWQLTKNTVLERTKHMFNNSLMSDIQFTCGDSKLKKHFAHKYVLATSSPVFYAMFYGDLAETKSVIHLPDTDDETLKAFLRYLYTEECATEAVSALKVIYLAKKYLVPPLVEKCWEIVDENVGKVLDSDLFLTVNRPTLEELLQRETLVIAGSGELRLIQAVFKWCDHQCTSQATEATGENMRAALGHGIRYLRFLALTQEEFTSNIAMSGLLTDKEVVAFFRVFNGMLSSDGKELIKLCSLPRRKGNSMSCIRFAQQDLMKPDKNRWNYDGDKVETLDLRVDKPALLHGIRLFGDAGGGEYQVEIKQPTQIPTATYTSTNNSDREGKCYGFDVMFPEPIRISIFWGTQILLKIIKGPNSYYGQNGKSCVVVDGITVTFNDKQLKVIDLSPNQSNGTNVKRGQIYELIISSDYTLLEN